MTPGTTDQELFDLLAERIAPLNDMHTLLFDGTRTAYAGTLERLTPSGFSLELVTSRYLDGNARSAAADAFTHGWLADGDGWRTGSRTRAADRSRRETAIAGPAEDPG